MSRVALNQCPRCGTELSSDEESILCRECWWRPTMLSDEEADGDQAAPDLPVLEERPGPICV